MNEYSIMKNEYSMSWIERIENSMRIEWEIEWV